MVLSILLYTNLGLDWAQTKEKDDEGWAARQFSNEIKSKGGSIVDIEPSKYGRLHMITIKYVAPSLVHYQNNNSWSHNLCAVHIRENNNLVQVLFRKTGKEW